MALNATPTFVRRPKTSMRTFNDAAGTDPLGLIMGTLEGEKIVGLFATGEVTAARLITVFIEDSDGNFNPIATKTVPLNAGRANGVPAVDLMADLRDILPKDADGQPYLFLSVDNNLRVSCSSAITTDETLTVFAVHGSFSEADV